MARSAGAGAVTGDAAGPLSYRLDRRGRLRKGLDPGELAAAYASSDQGALWVDIDSEDDAEWRLLTDVFDFHPLAVEDTRSPNCRVKLEEYTDHVFVVVRGTRLATWTPEPYDVTTSNLYLFLGRHWMVTVHAGRSPAIDAVMERFEGGMDVLGRGCGHAAYMVIDALVDHYFPLFDTIGDFVDGVEDQIFEGEDTIMQRVFSLRRTLLGLRRHLAPTREVVGSLANRPMEYLKPETQIFFRDVFDHVIRQLESVEVQRERLTSIMETYLSLVSNRTNEVMKVLSVMATLVLPSTLVASIYGMNFGWMPWLRSELGFWIALGMMGVVSGGFLIYVWRKGWL